MATVWTLLLLCLLVQSSQSVDLTRQTNAYGPDVVEAVVNIIRENCIFADDKRFLRRLAYVESHDGTDPKTFRAGYYGGIWQVDNYMFRSTQLQSARLAKEYAIIRDVLGIDWSTVSWYDLTKPLYSGLAAALYTKLESSTTSWKIEEQGKLWERHFHNGSSATNFTREAAILELGCNGNNLIDVVFVLDGSSSLSPVDFQRARLFVSSVVDGFNVSRTGVHVGMISYASSAHVQFRLNQYYSNADVKSAIASVTYPTGSTDTSGALTLATDDVFSIANGARAQAVKVLILVTDGASDDPIGTQFAALKAKQNRIVVFSVGVGSSVDTNELKVVATDPVCTHVFQATDYTEIRFLKEEIQQSTCLAPLYINTTYTCEISTCPPLAVVTKPGGVTIETNITCGGMHVYTAFNNPYPNGANYESNKVTNQGTPVSSFFNTSTERPLYINLKDLQAGQNTGCVATITPCFGDCTDHSVTVKCFQNKIEIPCMDKYFNVSCKLNWNFISPCTQQNLLLGMDKFTYPYDRTKFILCDKTGQTYIAQCPQGMVFFQDCAQCVGNTTAAATMCKTQAPTNPCTEQELLKHHYYHAYPGDVHKYIQCDTWGKAWVRDCQPGEEWNQGELTCIVPATYNPCRHHDPNEPLLYPHQCDPHRYIQCDLHGESFVRNCQLDYVFYKPAQVCVPPGAYPGTNGVSTCGGTTSNPIVHMTTFTVPHTVGTVPPQGSLLSQIQYTAPCTVPNIKSGNLYFEYPGDKHKYIQCDLAGFGYVKDCSYTGDPYYNPISHTCVDGPVVIPQLG